LLYRLYKFNGPGKVQILNFTRKEMVPAALCLFYLCSLILRIVDD